MSKRNEIKKVSAESIALKKLRIKSELSIRKLSDLMNLSRTRISQMESGRDEVSEQYVLKFLTALKLTLADFENQIGTKKSSSKLREICIELVSNLEPSRLEAVHELLIKLKGGGLKVLLLGFFIAKSVDTFYP
jgi:transcriptional regulator with XRE-family HTH domain